VTNRRVLAAILVVLGVVWLLVNGPVEGAILLKFDADHGLTVADLLSLAAFAMAVVLWFDRSKAPPRP
jgi:hypothetical protein